MATDRPGIVDLTELIADLEDLADELRDGRTADVARSAARLLAVVDRIAALASVLETPEADWLGTVAGGSVRVFGPEFLLTADRDAGNVWLLVGGTTWSVHRAPSLAVDTPIENLISAVRVNVAEGGEVVADLTIEEDGRALDHLQDGATSTRLQAQTEHAIATRREQQADGVSEPTLEVGEVLRRLARGWKPGQTQEDTAPERLTIPAGGLPVWSEPNRDASRRKDALAGTDVEIIEILASGWIRVRFPDETEGWLVEETPEP